VDLRAYFDDGTIINVQDVRYEKNVENIQSNLSEEPVQTYELKEGLLDGWKHEYPYVNKEESYDEGL
jgi:hypothetical protein